MKITCLVVFMCAGQFPAPAQGLGFQSERVNFSVRCNGLVLGHAIQSLFVIPEEVLEFEIVDANWKAEYAFETEVGQVVRKDNRHWVWTVPKSSGNYSAIIFKTASQESIQLNVFVLIPISEVKDNQLNGYTIGAYPAGKVITSDWYLPPKGFVEVTEENQDLKVSPHFRLKQFMCRQPSEFPKYLVLDERLLIKLECLLAKVNVLGYPCQTLSISSGYRTPYYNNKLGNTKYSAHLWGRAADIYIDNNYNNTMDDLNRNGKSDLGDVKIVREIVESLDQELRHQDKIGGIGIYEETDNHGPFVHIDVRGEPARWEKSKGK